MEIKRTELQPNLLTVREVFFIKTCKDRREISFSQSSTSQWKNSRRLPSRLAKKPCELNAIALKIQY